MNEFNGLVYTQMQTMEKLLCMQREIERCQKVEEELHCLQKMMEAEKIKNDIYRMKKELNEIQAIFDKQTEAVIQSYLQMEVSTCI